MTVTGSSFSSGGGNNAESTFYTFVDALGFTSLTFSTTGIAFEIAAAPESARMPSMAAVLAPLLSTVIVSGTP